MRLVLSFHIKDTGRVSKLVPLDQPGTHPLPERGICRVILRIIHYFLKNPLFGIPFLLFRLINQKTLLK